MPGPCKSALTEGRGIKQKITEGSIMKTKFSKLFVTILIVAAVTCCGALGVFAADDAKADTTAATTASETVNTDNDHNSSLSIGLVAAALATGLAGIGGGMAVASAAPAAIVALGESIALYGLVISIMILSKLV